MASPGKTITMIPPVGVFLREPRTRFFEGLDAPDIKIILSAAVQKRFPAKSVIFHQGDPAGHLYLLLTGRARRFFLTQDGEKVVLLRVTPKELFGEASLLPKTAEYLVSTEASTPISALVWSRSTMRTLCERYPRLVDNALLISFDYLAAYRAAHASLICNSAPERLARVLTNLANGIGQTVPGGVELDVRNEELAEEANISLFTASRLLSAWQREGILEKRRGKVLLHYPFRLSRRDLSTSTG